MILLLVSELLFLSFLIQFFFGGYISDQILGEGGFCTPPLYPQLVINHYVVLTTDVAFKKIAEGSSKAV